MNRTHARQHPLRATRWPVSHQRRHRSVHPPPAARWAGRAGCAIAIGGVVALGVWRPAPAIDVDRLAQVQDERVCLLVDALLDVAFVGISPPPDHSPEDFAATLRINARLSQMGETLRASEMVREMGC